MKARLTKELQLVTACCIWPPCSTRDGLIAQRLQAAPDWQRVADLASRHRVAGLVYDGLRRVPGPVPASLLSTLAAAASQQMRESLQLAAEAYRMTAKLEDSGVAVAVLKGAPLTVLAFGDLGLRHSRDNDLLVAPEDVERAASQVEAAGYLRTEPPAGWNAAELETWKQYRKHFEYFNAARNTRLELHWRLTDNTQLVQNPRVLQTLVQVPVASGLSLPALPVEQLLPYLFVHGATHGWFRLKWLADVAALLGEMSSAARRDLIAQAYQEGWERPALQGLELCRVVFGMPLSEMPQPDLVTRWLARSALRALSAEEPAGSVAASLRIVLQRYLLQPTWSYRRAQWRLDSSPRTDPRALDRGWRYPAARLQEWLRQRR